MLKRFILFLFISAALFSYGNAQSRRTHKSTLSFSAGPSFPVGDFASTDPENELAGFANTGEEIAISYTYMLDQHFGLSATLFGQRNGLNIKQLKQQLSQIAFVAPGPPHFTTGNANNPPSFPPPDYVYYSNWDIKKDSWLSGGLLIGGTGIFPLKKGSKLTFIIRGMAGIMYVTSPEIGAYHTTDSSKRSMEQSSGSAFGFSYRAYGGVRYLAGKRVSLLLGVNYLGSAKIRFSEVTSRVKAFYSPASNSWTDLNNSSIASSEYAVTASTKQIIQTIGLNFGIQVAL